MCSSNEDETFLPVSALNDLLYCERRCALHRIEQVWKENRYTLEGAFSHAKAHARPTLNQSFEGDRVVRGMWLRSNRLGLIGIADVVEFRDQPFPVEYKRGRRRRWENDDVQICAQALCLEEMLGTTVPAGAIFHVKSHRRRNVLFDDNLRTRTEQAAARLHDLFASRQTPKPVLTSRCSACSTRDICMPEVITASEKRRQYLVQLYSVATELSADN